MFSRSSLILWLFPNPPRFLMMKTAAPAPVAQMITTIRIMIPGLLSPSVVWVPVGTMTSGVGAVSVTVGCRVWGADVWVTVVVSVGVPVGMVVSGAGRTAIRLFTA